MLRLRHAPLLLCMLGTLAFWPRLAGAAARAQHVFIVSFDGGKPAVMQKSKMPVLLSMVREGACTWSARTVFPSITLPAHTSMLAGVGPEKHHVLWDDWQPDKGLVKVPTVFTLAKRRGLKTGAFVGKEKLRHLNVPGALDTFSVPAYSASTVAVKAAQYIKEQKPNLCFIHFADGDGTGHQFGWGSPEQMRSFADEDAALATLRKAVADAGIAGSSVFILTADHGGHDKTHGSKSPEDMTIPWIAWGTGVKRGYQIVAPVTTYDTAATALWRLGVRIPPDWDGKPVTSAFSALAKKQVPIGEAKRKPRSK